MKVHKLKCINCGAAIEIEDGIDTFFCKYCGHKMILEELTEASINAKVQIKKMEHQERMRDKQYEQERYKFNKKQQHKNNETSRKLISSVIAISGFVLLFVVFFGSAYVKSVREEQKLEAKVDEIMIDINNGDYDEAYIKANSLHYTSDWSSDVEVKWDNTRKALLEKIEQADPNMLKVSISSDEIVGENYETVISEMEKIGFTNIETKILDDLITGWLTKDGEIEQVKINGNTEFSADDSFHKESKIVITYHTFPKEKDS